MMIGAAKASRRRQFLGAATLLPLLACLGLTGCNRATPAAISPMRPSAQISRPVDEKVGVQSALAAFAQGTSAKSCRNALRQLNSLFVRQPDQKPPALSERQRQRLQNDFGLNADDLAEVDSPSFTQLDAHYVETCFLLRDAARSLEASEFSPMEKARAAFGWVIRQIALEESPEELIPPRLILIRTRGTSLERSLVFLMLLRQLGLPGCMVTIPTENGPHYWVPGVLIDREIYLFDTRMSMPIPGTKPNEIATLRQVRANPELLKRLRIGGSPERYDVTSDNAQHAELHLLCLLSGMAPRMKTLEGILSVQAGPALVTDPDGMAHVFENVGKAQALPIKFWNRPGEPDSPTLCFRRFFPRDEGGTDSGQRQDQWENTLVAWSYLPPSIRSYPPDQEPGKRLRWIFQQQFIGFFNSPDLPRGKLLRGDVEEATNLLVSFRDELNQQKINLQADTRLPAELAKWYEDVRQASADLLRTESALQRGRGAEGGNVDLARARVQQVWRDGEKLVTLLLTGSAAEPLEHITTYLLALAKQEAAEHLQARLDHLGTAAPPELATRADESWRGAADWWETFLGENPQPVWAAAARSLRARALEALHQPEAAAALLKDTSSPISDLDTTGRLYRAEHINDSFPH